ncbi:DUF5644 domain-containing protein [Helicobacter sp. T3_23-1056]
MSIIQSTKALDTFAIGTLRAEIFCFDARVDYEFYFKKCEITCTKAKPSVGQISTNQNLSEMLDFISSAHNIAVYQHLPKGGKIFDNLANDSKKTSPNIALKINGIALLGDEKIGELLERFGLEWRIEPLCTRFVEKDLRLDVEAMKSCYDEILSKWCFLSDEEKDKIYEFLPLNAINERGDKYIGDGFLLFTHYVAKNHKEHLGKILETISDKENGVLNYSSIQNLLYKQNPQIDMDIEWLISALLSQKSYAPMLQNLIKTSKNYINHQKDFIDFLDSNVLLESKNVDKKEIKYMLFDGYHTRYTKQSSQLIASCEKLCERLSIPLSKKDGVSFVYNGGHFARIYDLHLFIERTVCNVLQAMAKGHTLLFGDYASFCEAKFALEMNLILYALKNAKSSDTKSEKILDAQKLAKSLLEVQNLINQHEKKDALQAWLKQEPIAYIGDLLEGHLDSLDFDTSAKKNSLPKTLNMVAYTPNATSTLESRLGNTSYLTKLTHTINTLNAKSATKIDLLDIISQDFSHLDVLDMQCHSYLEESARIRFFGIDLGADALLVDSVEQCYIFDTKVRQSAKAYNRDIDSTNAMFLPSLALRLLT